MTETIGLAAAFAAVAPRAVAAVWLPALVPALEAAGITAPRRVAAFLGQCAHESSHFALNHDGSVPSENMNYTDPARLLAIFPTNVRSIEQARDLACHPEQIANCVYANRQGNGDEASGDGWRFRGGGLLQLTGRVEFEPFAASLAIGPEEAADFARTPDGAAVSACWYWIKHRLNDPADLWQIDAITRAINGAAMLGAAERAALSQRALDAIHDAPAGA